MAYENIITEKEGAAYIITFNRPKRRNAISVATMHEIAAALAEADADGEVRGIIVTGGQDFFSAGADLNEAMALDGPKDTYDFIGEWRKLEFALENTDKPIIAAIEGFCMTGGCEFILACDIRVAGKGSSFAITSSRIGTVAGAGGTQRLPRLVGMGKALEIMFAGDPIDDEEAERIGLINHLVETGGALAKAKEMVKVYEGRAPLSLAWIKRVVYSGMQMDLTSALQYERFIVSTIYETKDRKEGIGAFLEKRTAEFKGE